MKKKVQRIYLVRHAESEWNDQKRVQGTCLEVGLSKLGERQAERLGDALGELDFTEVYCSDAVRATETARIALGDNYPLNILAGLREISLGEWEGILISEIKQKMAEDFKNWFIRPTAVRITGGEDLNRYRKRAADVFNSLADNNSDGDVLIISHGGFICVLLTYLLKMDIDDFWSFSIPNASIATVLMDFKPRLRGLGDVSHLKNV